MIFVDTSFWVALRNARDAHHREAAQLFAAVSAPLITTNLIAGETFTFLARRRGHAEAVGCLDLLHASPRVEIKRVAESEEDQAWGWLRQHDERSYSFVDATSFATMKAMRIRDAFAFGGDFSAAGFRELRP